MQYNLYMTQFKLNSSLIAVSTLAENISAENLVLLDASMKPVTPVSGASLSETPAYIPGSLRFDYDNEIREKNTPLPHMMPTPEFFTEEMQRMGINKDSAVVVYDNVGVYASPRAWWMFRAMGHEQVAVLDGGLPAWIAAGHDTVPHLKALPQVRGNFMSHPQQGMFVDSNVVLNALQDSAFTVMDARSHGRFIGIEPEPRAGLLSGHMPNAINLPFADVLENNKMKSPANLRGMFEIYKNKKMIFSCGSGVTACILALAAEQAGHDQLAVYDGSWAEWGSSANQFPITKD